MFGRLKEPVRGWGTVRQLGTGPTARLEVAVAGMESFHVALDAGDLDGRWPPVGTVLPMEVDQRKPSRFRILWDEVGPLPTDPSGFTAEQLYGPQVGPSSPPAPTVVTGVPGGFTATHVDVVGAAPDDPRVAEAIRMAEGVMGVDLDGDGQVSPTRPGQEQAAQAYQSFTAQAATTGAPVGAPSSAAAARVDRLAQLAELHRQGSITDAEFAQLKADLLAEP